MAVSIKDPDTDRLIRELARRTGETQVAAVKVAVMERLAQLDREQVPAAQPQGPAAGDRPGHRTTAGRDQREH